MKCWNCGNDKPEVDEEGIFYCDDCWTKVEKEYDGVFESMANLDYELNKDREWEL